MSKEVAEVLRNSLAKFGPNGEHWRGFCDSSGHCACTAISESEHGGYSANEARALLCSVVGVSNDELWHLWEWNDKKGRKFKSVKAVYEKAIQLAEAA